MFYKTETSSVAYHCLQVAAQLLQGDGCTELYRQREDPQSTYRFNDQYSFKDDQQDLFFAYPRVRSRDLVAATICGALNFSIAHDRNN